MVLGGAPVDLAAIIAALPADGCAMPPPARRSTPLPKQRYGPSATDLLRTATSPGAVDAILAGAHELYPQASSGTKARWARVAAARKKQLEQAAAAADTEGGA